MEVSELRSLGMEELREMAGKYGINGRSRMKKEELIFSILRAQAKEKGLSLSEGVLEILPDGYGFLRDKTCLPGPNDIYVSPSQIKRFNLKDGDNVMGQVRPPKDDEKYFALLKVEAINFQDPEKARSRTNFDRLIPYHPTERLTLEHDPEEVSTRIIDLFAPIGKGQRGLIVSPPKAGKTTLLKHIAKGIGVNHPDIYLIILLVDERPEEVTDFRRSVEEWDLKWKYDPMVVAATFDQQPEVHTRVAELVIEEAKRLVEHHFDVMILIDSITRLARAYNLSISPSGKLLSGGIDPSALYKPKEFFGAARNILNGGSLTIIGTALIDTGSRLDQVVFEEFKGTGNMELVLDRSLYNKRIFPAIDLELTGTRKEELLLPKEVLRKVWILRKMITDMADKQAALEFIKGKMEATQNNEQFLELMMNE
jgi:transcription termination factor Rho